MPAKRAASQSNTSICSTNSAGRNDTVPPASLLTSANARWLLLKLWCFTGNFRSIFLNEAEGAVGVEKLYFLFPAAQVWVCWCWASLITLEMLSTELTPDLQDLFMFQYMSNMFFILQLIELVSGIIDDPSKLQLWFCEFCWGKCITEFLLNVNRWVIKRMCNSRLDPCSS